MPPGLTLPHIQDELPPPLARQLTLEFSHQLGADTRSPIRGMHRELPADDLVRVQLVDRIADDHVTIHGDRSDAVAIAQHSTKFFAVERMGIARELHAN